MAIIRRIEEIDPILTKKRDEFSRLFGTDQKTVAAILLTKQELQTLELEEWIVGFSIPKGNSFAILQEEDMGRPREEWLKVCIHEMLHIFYVKRFGTNQPSWFNEAVAYTFSGQQMPSILKDKNEVRLFFNQEDQSTKDLIQALIAKVYCGAGDK